MNASLFLRNRSRSGFSIIELLGVVAIGGILVSSLATTDFEGEDVTGQLEARANLICAVVDTYLVIDGDLNARASGDWQSGSGVGGSPSLSLGDQSSHSTELKSGGKLQGAAKDLTTDGLIDLLIHVHRQQDELIAVANGLQVGPSGAGESAATSVHLERAGEAMSDQGREAGAVGWPAKITETCGGIF